MVIPGVKLFHRLGLSTIPNNADGLNDYVKTLAKLA